MNTPEYRPKKKNRSRHWVSVSPRNVSHQPRRCSSNICVWVLFLWPDFYPSSSFGAVIDYSFCTRKELKWRIITCERAFTDWSICFDQKVCSVDKRRGENSRNDHWTTKNQWRWVSSSIQSRTISNLLRDWYRRCGQVLTAFVG